MASYNTVDARFPTFRRSDGVVQMLVPVPHCLWCFTPISLEYEDRGTCPRCSKSWPVDGFVLERVIAATLYVPKVTGLDHNREILRLKDTGEYVDQYAEVLVHVLGLEEVKLKKQGVLVPIPPTEPRPTTSGPIALAMALSKLTGVPVKPVLRRTREVKKQKELKTYEEREANVKDSMVCDESLRGKPAYIVDDIMTSGTTMHEAARALMTAKASSRLGLVAGRDAGISWLESVGVVVRDE